MPVADSDDGAEMDQFRDQILESNNVIVYNGDTSVEYICGEGDPPFIKYRLTIESISTHSIEEFEALKNKEAA